ncbi:MAG: hypothetical protein IPP35_07070 [Elusimicrobia bacterium]|nr:hypothetical protein [Elusimicrobiota bacterium]
MKDVKTIRAEKPEGQGGGGYAGRDRAPRGATAMEVALNEEVDIFVNAMRPGWTNTGIG